MAKILIVDDRPLNRQFLLTLLSYTQHRLLEAADGAEALDLVRKERPDLVVTDLLMPTMDGEELVRRMRAEPAIAATEVIFYTARYNAREASAIAEVCGVKTVIHKPAEAVDILKAIGGVLGGAALPAEANVASASRPLFGGPLGSGLSGFGDSLRSLHAGPGEPVDPDADPGIERDNLRRIAVESSQALDHAQSVGFRLAALLEIGIDLMSYRTPEELLGSICSALREITAAHFAGICMLDTEGVPARWVTRGLGEQARVALLETPMDPAILGPLLTDQRPIRLNDLKGDPRAAGLPAAHPPISSFMALPIASFSKSYGWLYVADKLGSAAFSDDDVRIAQTLTAQLAVAYENLILYDEQERHARELEAEVADRREAERAAVAAQQRLDHVLVNSPTVTYLLGIEGEVLHTKWVSENLGRITGYPRASDARPEWWLAQIHPDDRGKMDGLLSTVLARGRARAEYRVRHVDGGYLVLRDEMNVVRDSTGRPVEVVGTLLDITEQRRLEEQLRQSQKMEAIGLLAGGVAHDFNNLLTVILGHCELMLLRPQPDGPSRRAFELVQKSAQRAANLTRRLLEFSRRQVVVPKVFDLNSAIVEEAKLLRQLLRENIDLIMLLEPNLPRITADPGQIEQVILNLVINAQDAMPGNGKIIIETSSVYLNEEYLRMHSEVTAGPYVLMVVSDGGCGMDAETLRHIFEPFFTTKAPGKGTGLGLSTVYGIVKQSRGHLDVYSEPGIGTTFKIYLPQAEDQTAQPRTPAVEAPPGRGEEVILLVEDEEGVRNLVSGVLEMHGYTVLTARHGGEALQVCREHRRPIHLVVTDVIMPQMGGLELVQNLRRLHPEIKVLFISGYTNQGLFHTGRMEMGGPFLQKPFTPTALAHKVREVLDL